MFLFGIIFLLVGGGAAYGYAHHLSEDEDARKSLAQMLSRFFGGGSELEGHAIFNSIFGFLGKILEVFGIKVPEFEIPTVDAYFSGTSKTPDAEIIKMLGTNVPEHTAEVLAEYRTEIPGIIEASKNGVTKKSSVTELRGKELSKFINAPALLHMMKAQNGDLARALMQSLGKDYMKALEIREADFQGIDFDKWRKHLPKGLGGTNAHAFIEQMNGAFKDLFSPQYAGELLQVVAKTPELALDILNITNLMGDTKISPELREFLLTTSKVDGKTNLYVLTELLMEIGMTGGPSPTLNPVIDTLIKGLQETDPAKRVDAILTFLRDNRVQGEMVDGFAKLLGQVNLGDKNPEIQKWQERLANPELLNAIKGLRLDDEASFRAALTDLAQGQVNFVNIARFMDLNKEAFEAMASKLTELYPDTQNLLAEMQKNERLYALFTTTNAQGEYANAALLNEVVADLNKYADTKGIQGTEKTALLSSALQMITAKKVIPEEITNKRVTDIANYFREESSKVLFQKVFDKLDTSRVPAYEPLRQALSKNWWVDKMFGLAAVLQDKNGVAQLAMLGGGMDARSRRTFMQSNSAWFKPGEGANLLTLNSEFITPIAEAAKPLKSAAIDPTITGQATKMAMLGVGVVPEASAAPADSAAVGKNLTGSGVTGGDVAAPTDHASVDLPLLNLKRGEASLSFPS